MRKLRRTLAVFVAAGALTVLMLVVGVGSAAADYGPGAKFQIAISANNVGGVPGDGAWMWIALYPGFTGDYTAADCIHTGSLLGHPGLNGAAHEQGDVTWSDSNGWLTINGVALIGGQVPVTIKVPDTFGHSVLPSDSVILGFGLGGWAQVQVSP